MLVELSDLLQSCAIYVDLNGSRMHYSHVLLKPDYGQIKNDIYFWKSTSFLF